MSAADTDVVSDRCPYTSDELIALHDRVKAMSGVMREWAGKHPTRGAWGAITFLDSACYDLWGAMGYLAQSEGLLGPEKKEEGHERAAADS